MTELVGNYINGNLKEAKRIAKRYKIWEIRSAFLNVGYSLNKATLVSDWLKGRDCYQVACNAE